MSRDPSISIHGAQLIPAKACHNKSFPRRRRTSRLKSNSFGNASAVSTSTAVLQGAHIIGQLKHLRHSLAGSVAFDIQQLIEEVLLLVSMKTEECANDPETMSRLTRLVDLSKHPVHRPVAEWILNDFFDQNTRSPNASTSSIFHRMSRVSEQRTSSQMKLHRAVDKISIQQQVINRMDVLQGTKNSAKMISKSLADPICTYFNAHCNDWDFDIFVFEDICQQNGVNAFTAFTTHIILPVAAALKLDTELVATYFHEIRRYAMLLLV